MSTLDGRDDDWPIDIEQHQFTIADVCFLSHVEQKAVRNWTYRGIVPVGHRNPITGRWLFSARDVVRLSVCHACCIRAPLLSLTDANTIADIVIAEGERSTEREANRDGRRPNVNVLVAWTDAGELLATTVDMKAEAGRYYPPSRGPDDLDHPLRRPHLVIPATVLFIDTILRTKQLLAENVRRAAAAVENEDA